MSLNGKHIVIGISGGIAAYKIPELVRLCTKQGAEVRVVMTQNAQQFVTPLTLQTVSGNAVYTDMFTLNNSQSTQHISLSQWADLLVVAPATANVIAKMANGIADDALTTTYLAFDGKVIIAPAMNHNMLHHEATQTNQSILHKRKNHIILDTSFGQLACRTDGDGRMKEPSEIMQTIQQAFIPQDLIGQHILITAGPTHEYIDPVRFISNASSGKMGIALANECAMRGAEVTLVSGPIDIKATHPNITTIEVKTAQEMCEQTTKIFQQCNIGILCAAVADFTPTKIAPTKIKEKQFSLELYPTTDIAAQIGKIKRQDQTLIGFALETNNELEHAKQKLVKKNLDYIILNSLNDKGAGFQYDTNQISIINKDGNTKEFPLKLKTEVAKDIIDYCC